MVFRAILPIIIKTRALKATPLKMMVLAALGGWSDEFGTHLRPRKTREQKAEQKF